MSERMNVCYVAYRKGVQAAKSKQNKPANPYVKRELQQWWDNGYNDCKDGLI